MTDAITSIANSSNVYAIGDGSGVNKKENSNLGKDDFLKLLVAQLKYQDPEKPTDSSQFMAQTAQFTLVEKFEEVAKSQNEILTAARAQSATSMVGRKVTWTGTDGASQSGVVNAVSILAGVPSLSVGDKSVSLETVTRVENPTA
jgi:flagellar basal-body rod modification protein FlgD